VLSDISLQPIVDRLSDVSPEALYVLIVGASFAEGVLPPVPGDVAAAFLSFLSARAGGLWLPTTLAVIVGSVGGNCVPWWLGRRYGAAWLTRQMGRFTRGGEQKAEDAERRIENAYREYGWIALFISRFIPGIRAMAPAAAGALRVPLWETMAILFAASAIWYSGVTWIAFRVGSDWAEVKAAMTTLAQRFGIGAGVVLIAGGAALWWYLRRRARAGERGGARGP
jgi:membrane protein DedA with SNARE-associated domain